MEVWFKVEGFEKQVLSRLLPESANISILQRNIKEDMKPVFDHVFISQIVVRIPGDKDELAPNVKLVSLASSCWGIGTADMPFLVDAPPKGSSIIQSIPAFCLRLDVFISLNGGIRHIRRFLFC
jgi:hypothetical protein